VPAAGTVEMESEFSLSIADVSFTVDSDVPVAGHDEEPYAPFTARAGREAADDLPVTVRAINADAPNLTEDQKLFEGDRAWAMYRDESGRHVVGYTGRRRKRRRLWQARISNDLDSMEIVYEQELVSSDNEKKMISNPLRRPLDEIAMTYVLARLEGLILDGIAAVVAGKGLILAGRTGSGKTRAARILGRYDDFRVLSDGRAVIRPSGLAELKKTSAKGGDAEATKPEKWFNVFGTPWIGPTAVSRNESAPLHAVLFLAPGGPNRAIPLPLAAVEGFLNPLVNIPWQDPEIAPVVQDFCRRVTAAVPAYELQFKPRRSFAKYLRNFAGTLR